MNYFYMSFADSNTGKSLGVCIVYAHSEFDARRIARELNIHPGGETLFFQFNGDIFEKIGLELNRLYTEAEILSMKGFSSLGELEGKQ